MKNKVLVDKQSKKIYRVIRKKLYSNYYEYTLFFFNEDHWEILDTIKREKRRLELVLIDYYVDKSMCLGVLVRL